MILRRRLPPPISYWGGKHNAVRHIFNYVPERTKRACCPFIGGGSVECNLAANGVMVRAGDSFPFIIDLWRALVHTGTNEELQRLILELDPTDPLEWRLQKNRIWKEPDPHIRAALLYNINNHSFSGKTLVTNTYVEGGIRNVKLAVLRLGRYAGLPIRARAADWTETLAAAARTDLVFCDPPYDGFGNPYGREMIADFDHGALRDALRARPNWLVTYGDTPAIRRLYEGCHAVAPDYLWTSGNKRDGRQKRAEELLIMSDAVAEACPSIWPRTVGPAPLSRGGRSSGATAGTRRGRDRRRAVAA